MRRLLIVAIILSMFGSIGVMPARADQQQDITDARARAEEIFQLAADGQYNAMYDLIHPDARAIIPRTVAVNTFKELYALAEAGKSKITNVEMGPWTWGVTGKSYDNAAAVSFEQPYVDNGQQKVLKDTMYLVKAEDGQWRWFFGGTKEFVDLAIKTFGDKNEAGLKSLGDGNRIENTVKDLDAFYRDAFSYTDLKYETPGVVVVAQGQSERTACGPAQTGFWAFYCPGDATLYLDEPFLQQLGQQAPFAESFVIAHEWAHHVQTTVGLVRVQNPPTEWNEVFSVELELMADCMAGAWAQDVASRGLLGENDIQQTVDFALQYLGDPPGVGTYDPQAHGTAEQRANAIMSGYQDGFLACNIQI
jgi:hypothetical protein